MDTIMDTKQNENIIQDITDDKQNHKTPKIINKRPNLTTNTIFDIQGGKFTLFDEEGYPDFKA